MGRLPRIDRLHGKAGVYAAQLHCWNICSKGYSADGDEWNARTGAARPGDIKHLLPAFLF